VEYKPSYMPFSVYWPPSCIPGSCVKLFGRSLWPHICVLCLVTNYVSLWPGQLVCPNWTTVMVSIQVFLRPTLTGCSLYRIAWPGLPQTHHAELALVFKFSFSDHLGQSSCKYKNTTSLRIKYQPNRQ